MKQEICGRTAEAASEGRPACGALAQLGEHLLCKQRVTGSIPVGSTKFRLRHNLLSPTEFLVCAPLARLGLRTSGATGSTFENASRKGRALRRGPANTAAV